MEKEASQNDEYEEYARRARIEREIAARVVACTGVQASWRHLNRDVHGVEEVLWQQSQATHAELDNGSEATPVRGDLQVMSGVFPMNTGY